MNDMITVFNQLTHSELTDYSLFEEVLDNHYEKYRFFYNIMEPIELDKVKNISCEVPAHETELLITVEFDSQKDLNSFLAIFEARLCDAVCRYFTVYLEQDGDVLNISIENKNISREGEIYEDRFDTY